jgi:2-amino-4-hydroxy-6-hydroxymethyldihydropteridine diphosphokinase
MKKIISNELTLFTNTQYCYKKCKNTKKRYIAYIGIGGNIDNVQARFKRLFKLLKGNRIVTLVEVSPLLENPPFGYLEQNKFLNGVIIVETKLSPLKLLNYLQRLENRFGRKRSFQDAPRTLDLDIIKIYKKSTGYQEIRYKNKSLEVPHPKYIDRESVTIPMNLLGYNSK